MKNSKILIVEDEVLIAEFIFELLTEESFNSIKIANSKEEANQIMNEFEPDIILMDINLNGSNSGIELAKQKNANAAIIFLTGQYDNDLMTKALGTNPESYLTKPIKQNDLFAAIQLAFLKSQLKSVTVKDGSNTIKIKLDSILYVKSDGNYIDIHAISKKYSVRMSLEAFLNETKDSNFIRVHRSYVINKSKVTKSNSTTAFIGTEEIPISRNLNFEL
jgi:DNA-binding LytR/AlgR family response regulator